MTQAEVSSINNEISTAIKKTDVANEMKNAAQHIKNATSSDELQTIAETANKKAQTAREAAGNAVENAEKLNTRKSRIKARVAENRATQAELQAKKTAQKVQSQQEFLEAEKLRKANATVTKTPEQIQKQEINGQKAAQNAEAREIKREAAKPQNQRKSTVDIATGRIIPSISKKYPNTDEGNKALLEIMTNSTEAPKRNAAKAILESRNYSIA